MNKLYKKEIVILRDGIFYKFISCELRPDGSFYIFLKKKGKFHESLIWNSKASEPTRKILKSPMDATRKISYHCTGEVHYYNTSNKRIFCDPLIDIKGVNSFGSYILPNINFLDKLKSIPKKSDYILELTNHGPYQFDFSVAPLDTIQINSIHFFPYLFSFAIHITKPTLILPKEANDAFLTPETGRHESQPVNQTLAYKSFHQKINNKSSHEPILYAPDNEKVWTLVVIRKMCSTPILSIGFKDEKNEYQIENLPEENQDKEKYLIKFKVRGKSGYVSNSLEIKSLVLDSRLGVYNKKD